MAVAGWIMPGHSAQAAVKPERIAGRNLVRVEIVKWSRGLGTGTEVIPGNRDLTTQVLVNHELGVGIVLRTEVSPSCRLLTVVTALNASGSSLPVGLAMGWATTSSARLGLKPTPVYGFVLAGSVSILAQAI